MIFNNSFYTASHVAVISFLFSIYSLFFFSDFCNYILDFFVLSHLLANFPIFWLFLVLFGMLWMLVARHSPCYVPHALRITTWENVFTEIFLGVSKEWVRSWSHAFLITNLKTLVKKLLTVRPEKVRRRKKRNKSRMAIAKLFVLKANAKR